MSTTEPQPDPEAGEPVPPPQEPEAKGEAAVEAETAAPPPPPPPPTDISIITDLALRLLVFASTLTAVVVIGTSEQTDKAKFTNSPSYIYFVAALSVVALYSLTTALGLISVVLKPDCLTCLSYFLISDVVMLGLVASATGAAATEAYIGLKGNKYMNWVKVCSVYDKYCEYLASSISLSLFAAIALIILIILSILTLLKKIPQ